MNPTMVSALAAHAIEAVDGGEHHSLGLTKEGRVLVWGRADSHQLGQPAAANSDAQDARSVTSPCMLPAETLCDVVHISTSANHCASISHRGTLFTWGFGELYQVPQHSTVRAPPPSAVDAHAMDVA